MCECAEFGVADEEVVEPGWAQAAGVAELGDGAFGLLGIDARLVDDRLHEQVAFVLRGGGSDCELRGRELAVKQEVERSFFENNCAGGLGKADVEAAA